MSNNTLLPANIDALAAYSSAKSEKLTGTTWLNANESPYVKNIDINISDLNRYPDPQPASVINRYAEYAQLSTEQVLMTRGADEGIELLVRTYCAPAKDSIALFLPTYGMYKVTADTHNVAINGLNQTLLLEGSVDDIVSAVGNSKLVFICNPNNPTGSLTSLDKIKAIATALEGKALVIVDEAYIEFCPEQSASSLINEFANIVVLRTLSKAFALAGLRTGFTLAQESVLAPIRKVIAPYPVSTVVASIAANALSPDAITSMRRQVSILNALKEKLKQWLQTSPAVLNVLSGEGNFVTLKLANKNSFNIALKQGLVMRAFTLYGENDWLRISIGSEQELEQVKVWLDGLSQSTVQKEQEVS
ncbi:MULTISPECIES: histidinol-phosphate transaminase [unclassified Pseudoalteromonas]|uniref:histidinol-phosphate transaminase n=1 Tax=unclassified Pseudoalteromonas TaxID=194690 RepID=UPI0025B57EEB|nr:MULTISPECIES: histidinol-phosphate transaminase [unclassified Pseudoalteromonas]MDN3380260.1 histidinol-phosphate transaminase [Pseudoalteromonas sp. APC 3893]MDN3388650.1 histidinol-phosphate transaminase [Pseudoalteromonas sp. APC 4017]